MPTYCYECKECGYGFNVTKKMSESSSNESCPECSANECLKVPAMTQVMFKGDGWVDKNTRIKNQMSQKNKKLEAKENEMKRDAPNVTLVPNVNGERVDSWSDAQKLAKDMGKNTESYNDLVKLEAKSKKM